MERYSLLRLKPRLLQLKPKKSVPPSPNSLYKLMDGIVTLGGGDGETGRVPVRVLAVDGDFRREYEVEKYERYKVIGGNM